MKNRTIIYMAMLTAVGSLTSCHKSADVVDDVVDDVVPEQEAVQRAITFDGARNSQAATRADDTHPLNDLGITTFKVWGYKHLGASTQQSVFGNGYYVEHTADGWVYEGTDMTDILYKQNLKYWDSKATGYRFYATAPFVASSQLELLKADGTSTTVTSEAQAVRITYAIDGSDLKDDGTLNTANGSNLYYSDVIILTEEQARAKADGGDDSPVTLAFNQPMAKVRIMFDYAEGIQPNNVSIANLSFHPVTTDAEGKTLGYANTKEKGTAVKAYITLTGAADGTVSFAMSAPEGYMDITEPYEELADGATRLPHATVAKRWYYVVPINKDAADHFLQGAYVLEGVFNAKPKAAQVPAEDLHWEAGHEYTYKFKVTETSIAFDEVIEVYTKWQVGYSWNGNW